MLVLRRRRLAVEEKELGSHQADAFGARLDSGGCLGRLADIADDFHAMPVQSTAGS